MKRIRVVEIVGNSTGGGTHLVLTLIARLDLRQFDVTLVAPDSADLSARCAQMGVRYYPLPLLASRINRQARLRLQRMLRELLPDVIHAHGTRAAWFVSQTLGHAGRSGRFVYSEHLFSFDAREGIWRLPWYMIERHLCRRVDYLTTSCQVNARRVVAAGWTTPERIWVDHYGIDLEAIRAQVATPEARAELGVALDVPVVGAVGRLIAQKGIRYLIDAATRVLEVQPATVFLVIGDGVLRASLEAYCQARGVAGSFRFLGDQPRPWRYLALCELIALPSLYEGLPLVALEALAAELPVVATTVGGCPEVVIPDRTGLLVQPRDGAALADAILRLLHDPSRRATMRTAAIELARQYDVRHVVDAFTALYEECARRQSAPTGALASEGVS